MALSLPLKLSADIAEVYYGFCSQSLTPESRRD
jgi:hypothetical protein